MSGEKQPLKGNSDSKPLYFLNKNTTQEATEGGNVEMSQAGHQLPSVSVPAPGAASTSWFGSLFRPRGYQSVGNLQRPRKVPIKVEPKVFFANERTFLAWLHMSVTLASISVAIVAFAEANEWSEVYGLALMPVAIAFCIYSLYVFMKRAAMIRRKDPGPYEDRIGPVMLATMLGLAITINFAVKLYSTVG